MTITPFLSWSGARSLKAANAWGEWLPTVFPGMQPWLSPQIQKGTNWFQAIQDQLNRSTFGLAIVTSDNHDSAWLHYECGVLVGAGKQLCTFLLDLRPSDIIGPLAANNHTLFEKNDVYELCRTINRVLEAGGHAAFTDPNLRKVFEQQWESLNEALTVAYSMPARSTQQDLLNDIRARLYHLNTWLYGGPVTTETVMTWGNDDYGPLPFTATVEDIYRLVNDPTFVPGRLRAMYPHWDGKPPFPWDAT